MCKDRVSIGKIRAEHLDLKLSIILEMVEEFADCHLSAIFFTSVDVKSIPEGPVLVSQIGVLRFCCKKDAYLVEYLWWRHGLGEGKRWDREIHERISILFNVLDSVDDLVKFGRDQTSDEVGSCGDGRNNSTSELLKNG